MKKPIFMLISIVILLASSDGAIGACDCKQPAYRDEIDFLTRYTACLEQCYNSLFDSYNQRITGLESELDRLKGRIKELEDELDAVEIHEGKPQ